MTLDRLIPNEEVLAEDLQESEFREQWERGALARWLAIELTHYRAEHELSQQALAGHLGVQQSDVARMESGRVTPSFFKLIRIVSGLGIEMMIDIHPEGEEAKLPKKHARRRSSHTMNGVEVVLATA